MHRLVGEPVESTPPTPSSLLVLNPQKFIDIISESFAEALEVFMIAGIKYEKIAGTYYEMKLFESEELESYLDNWDLEEIVRK